MMKLVGAAIGIAIALMVIRQLPDIQRYWRIRQM